MNLSKFLYSVFFSALFIFTLHAQENEPLPCSESFDLCVEDCDMNDKSTETCYEVCNEKFYQCLDAENNEIDTK